MARITGVDLPKNKRVVIGLTYIYGIGKQSAEKICADANVDVNTRVNQLKEDEVKRIRTNRIININSARNRIRICPVKCKCVSFYKITIFFNNI